MNAVVVDDDPLIRSLLSDVLTNAGYKVDSYSSPSHCPLYTSAACPCSLKDSCPDVIVSDFDMPVVNGVEFVEQLKRNKCKCRNIAVMSGSWTEENLQRALPAGVSVFSKPLPKRFWAWLDKIKGQREGVAYRVNRRTAVRYACELPLDMYFSSPGLLETVGAVARNISTGGMLVECPKALAPMTSCQLAFTVPEWMTPRSEMGKAVMLSAEVRHADKASGYYGMQFLEPFL